MSTCGNCKSETNGVSLCVKCATTLQVSLVNVPAYHADVSRIRPGERVKVRGVPSSTPPPSPDAPTLDRIGETVQAVENSVSTWVRALEGDRDVHWSPPRRTADTAPGLDVRSACMWLEHHRHTIVTLEWAGELLRDLLVAERNLLRIIDNSDTGWYAGACGNELAEERPHDHTTCGCGCHHDYDDCDIDGGCGREDVILPAVVCERSLYATVGATYVRCPECGQTWRTGERREKLMKEARDELAPVAIIARAVVGLMDGEVSVAKLANRIDKWVSRERLKDVGVRVLIPGGKPQRVYRLGDVFDLMQLDQTPVSEPDEDGMLSA